MLINKHATGDEDSRKVIGKGLKRGLLFPLSLPPPSGDKTLFSLFYDSSSGVQINAESFRSLNALLFLLLLVCY